jgi:DNA-binding SARP family transcriptional activator/tetratricopeptide (TPR) repeat protein
VAVRALLLGTPRILAGSDETLLPATRPAALLAYLACRRSWVTRDELALVFRPDAGDAEARVYLRKLIFRARALPFAAGLEVTDERVRWSISSDLADLRSAVAAGHWSAAARIDAGPLLDGFHVAGLPGYEAWLEIEREAAAALWRRGVTQHAAALEAAGAVADAIGVRERYLEREPLDEEVVQDHLRALVGAADRTRGLAAYELFARHLEREVGGPPSEVTQALADALRALPIVGVRAGAAATPRDDLPRPATSFIGRRDEIERLATLLLPEGPRLVTIVGLGGVGKTRLALEAVRRVADDTTTQVVFVPLVPPPPGGRLADAIAAALGIDADEDRLHAALAQGPVLLLLDDAEDVMAAGGTLEADALLRRSPALRLVVTSRVPLGLAAEHIVPVEGLPAPATEAAADLRTSDAVALFLRRAASVSPEIHDDPETLRCVGEICRSLGGLPLAIELAASWTRTLSVAALLDELRGGEDLLRTDAPDVPERQRSVRVVIEQAWQGLRAHHREALARLTVFRGPWSLAAAREVAGADLATMLALLSSSLVRRSSRDRFEMHELVRRAAPSAPDQATHDAHARHTLGWLRDVGPELTSGDQAAALAVVHASLPDVREAWHHAARRGMVGELAGALVALDHALHARSLWAVAREAYRTALDHLPATPAAAMTRVRLQVRLANIERNVGDTEAARALLQAAMADREVPRGRPQVEARLELAKLDDFVCAFGAAAASYREVLADAGPEDDDLRGAAHTGLGNVLFSSGGDTSDAMHHYEEGLRAARRSREMDLVTIALINLGAGHYDMGQLEAARRSWREAARLASQLGNRLREASTLNNLAALAERAGDNAAAREAYDRSLRVRQEVGDRRGAARVLLNLGRLAQSEGRIDDADAFVEASVAGYEALDAPADLAHAVATRARLRVALGDLGGAQRMTERALRLGRAASDRTSMLVGLLSAATIALRRGRAEEARRGAALVAALTVGSKEGVRSSALALVEEAETRLASERSEAVQPVDGLPEVAAAPPDETVLAAEVDRVLRRG